jgi:ubiquinone/menaquinone biosynthesis C-methylase UbiE
VIEIGCGPGAAAREVGERIGPTGHVLAIDRSAKAIEQLTGSPAELISAARLTFRQVTVEQLQLDRGEDRYDCIIAFTVRVGALDGRHSHSGALALERLCRVLVPGGRLFHRRRKPTSRGDRARAVLAAPPIVARRRSAG